MERRACVNVFPCVDREGNSVRIFGAKEQTGATEDANQVGILGLEKRAAAPVRTKPRRSYGVTQSQHVARGKTGSC